MEESLVCKSTVSSQSGSFSFEVDGFLNLSDEVGETVESPEFMLCSRLWQLRIFPGGSLQAHKGYLSFYLASKSTVVTRASYKLIISRQRQEASNEQDERLSTTAQRLDEVFSSTGVRKFEARGVHVDGWGRDKFINNVILRDPSNGFIVNNKIIFRVEIVVFGDLDTPQSKALIASRKENYLKNDLSKILFEASTADIRLLVGDDDNMETIFAHRAIISARSPVFHAMLESRGENSMSELTDKTVRIPDVEPGVMKELCTYMYTEDCSVTTLKNSADRILYVAVKYQVMGLVHRAEEFLSTVLCVENAADMLQLADMNNATSLRDCVVQFISLHAKEVTESESYRTIRCDLQEEISKISERSTKKCWKRMNGVDKSNWQCIII